MAWQKHIFPHPWDKISVDTAPLDVWQDYKCCGEVNVTQNIQQVPSWFGDPGAEFDPFPKEGFVLGVP